MYSVGNNSGIIVKIINNIFTGLKIFTNSFKIGVIVILLGFFGVYYINKKSLSVKRYNILLFFRFHIYRWKRNFVLFFYIFIIYPFWHSFYLYGINTDFKDVKKQINKNEFSAFKKNLHIIGIFNNFCGNVYDEQQHLFIKIQTK